MTLLLWFGLWVVLSFAVAPLLGAAMRDREPPVRTPVPVPTRGRDEGPTRLPWSA